MQSHVQNGLGLDIVQAEPLAQPLFGVVIALPDDFDDLINVVLGDEQALQQMSALLGLLEVIFGAPDDDLLLEGDVLIQDVTQGEDLGL